MYQSKSAKFSHSFLFLFFLNIQSIFNEIDQENVVDSNLQVSINKFSHSSSLWWLIVLEVVKKTGSNIMVVIKHNSTLFL